jgi:hypothetical protein
MANTILTAPVIAKESLALLTQKGILSKLCFRDYQEEFTAGVGDTVHIRKPATFEAKAFNGTIQVQDVTEGLVSVKMDQHLDVSFAVTDKEMSLDVADFSKQLLEPAMDALVRGVERQVASLASQVEKRFILKEGTMGIDQILAARQYLSQQGAPLQDRSVVTGTQAEMDLLKTDLFLSAAAVGDDGTALREASLGRKLGMDFYTSQVLDEFDGDYIPTLVFHKNAIALVTRPLALPQGAANAAVYNYDGLSLRVVCDYDTSTKTDTVSIDMLMGTMILDQRLVTVIEDQR